MFSAIIDDKEWIFNIKTLSEISEDILKFQNYNERYIKSLKEKIKSLENNETLQQALKEKNKAIAAMQTGFYIYPEDEEKIKEWQKSHELSRHNGKHSSTAIGGAYSYSFTPTSIGIFKSCECNSCSFAARQDSKGVEKEYQKLLKDYDAIFSFGDSEI